MFPLQFQTHKFEAKRLVFKKLKANAYGTQKSQEDPEPAPDHTAWDCSLAPSTPQRPSHLQGRQHVGTRSPHHRIHLGVPTWASAVQIKPPARVCLTHGIFLNLEQVLTD